MITAAQALAAAFAAAVQHFGGPFIGTAVVISKESQYHVALIVAEPSDAPQPALRADATVVIDRVSGGVVGIRDGVSDKRILEAAPRVPRAGQLDAPAAYERAIAALQGFDRYDKFGELSIILMRNHYEVTFPRVSAADGSIGDNFAYKVWIDAKSGETIKILVPS